ncbi:MAG TPA: DUF222 domain-containing protein [Geodermatophilus sp.]|nr:DUF222 domain-containing protein [Geodermatophilus sp.]
MAAGRTGARAPLRRSPGRRARPDLLTLTRRFPATLGLLRRGEIDEARARVVADLLGRLEDEVAGRVEALVLPRAGTQTPTNLAAGIRRAIDRLDAAARRRRHERARADAEVRWWATQDGMARLAADLDLPVAAACGRRIDLLARQLRDGGNDRPMGRLRAEVLADLVLRPWAERPSVTAQLVVHASLPTLAWR